MDSKSEDLERGARKHSGWGDAKYDAAQGKHGPKEGGARWDPLGSFRQHFVYWSFISFLVCYHLYSVVQHNRENEGVRWVSLLVSHPFYISYFLRRGGLFLLIVSSHVGSFSLPTLGFAAFCLFCH